MKNKITLTVCCSLIGLLAQAQLCLDNTVDYVTGKYPYSLIAHDFTGDGILDYATVSTAPMPANAENTVLIMAGNGDETFAPLPGNPTNAVGSNPLFMTQADYNEDNIPDIVTSNNNGNSISVLLGTGGGYFSAAVDIAIPLGVWPTKGIASADFNLDTHQDLVISGNGKFIIALGDGSGAFTLMSPVNSYGQSQEVFVGNFNTDTYPDVAISSDSGRIVVMLSTGPATFASPAYYVVGDFPLSIDGADFNEDGYTDLFVTDPILQNISIIFGTSTGAFTAATSMDVFDLPANAIAVDVNNDTHMDIVVTTGNDLEVFLGDGAGNFDAPEYFSSGQLAGMDVVSGDFNNDGEVDIISSYYNDGMILGESNIAVFLNCRLLTTNAFSNSQISFYPNPTTGIIHIDSISDDETHSVLIFDRLGRKINESTVENGSIDISALSSGIYLMKYREQTAKIIKQ